jgi:ribosomal protein S18 acetylase RimI-like enzyme
VLIHRKAETLDDLCIATGLMSRAWRAGSPFVAGSPGGIEWWHAASFPDALGDHLRLWSADDVPVAWSWHEGGELEWHVWTGQPARDLVVSRAVLETALDEAAGGAVGTWAAEDDLPTIDLLVGLGLRPAHKRLSQFVWRPSEGPLPDAAVPRGYRIRTVAGPADIPARVEVHRAAFTPSRMNVEKYERLVTLPHYRYEDDLVVEAPDGTFAAFAMAWWDADGAMGEFEPVGTHPDHQRQGLARALLTFGMRRFADRGAAVVQVYADAASVAPEALYPAVGFRRRAFHRRYERPGTAEPDVRSEP